MIERIAKRSLQFADARNNAGIHERIEILKTIGLVEQGTKLAQPLHVLFRKDRSVRFRQNLEERNLERRKRKRSIETVTASLPLPRNARMAEQKRSHEIGLVAVGGGIIAVAGKVSE